MQVDPNDTLLEEALNAVSNTDAKQAEKIELAFKEGRISLKSLIEKLKDLKGIII